MEDNRLIIPANTIAILKKHNLTLQKKFGQNFLIDAHVLDKIIRAAEIGPSDMVLEIGPGIGTMTQALSGAAGKVVAVEIDRNLETKSPGLFVIGDCSGVTHSLSHASASGVHVARHILGQD